MFSRIRRRFTFANVAMTLALVFAMSGGAYAAKHYLITSTKQISPKVLRQLKGTNGRNGTNGVNGTNGKDGAVGAKGDAGPQGVEGKEGKAGLTGATGATGAKGLAGPEGVCSTANCVLPKGVSLKGMWAVRDSHATGFEGLVTAVSFNIPLASAPTPHVIAPGVPSTGTGDLTSGSAIVKHVATTGNFGAGSPITGTGIPAGTIVTKNISFEEFELSAEATATAAGVALTSSLPAGCSGSASAPGAETGNLCIFMEEEQGIFWTTLAPQYDPNAESPTKFGFILRATTSEEGLASANGTWAVTG
jgi:hypothetical protein